jgi:hypothetical protein
MRIVVSSLERSEGLKRRKKEEEICWEMDITIPMFA